jgi:hypothetical protein
MIVGFHCHNLCHKKQSIQTGYHQYLDATVNWVKVFLSALGSVDKKSHTETDYWGYNDGE